MNSWISVGTNFLSNIPTSIWIASGLIVGFSLLSYIRWFHPHAIRLQRALEALAKAIKDARSQGWAIAQDKAREAAKTHPQLLSTWHETEERVLQISHDQRSIFVMFGVPRDLWSANRLLGRSINLPLAEAMPNLLVGIGLLFTFFFLTIAITEATTALVPSDGGAVTKDLTEATRGLLSAAGAKFSTSLFGLLASILWTFFFRYRMARLSAATEAVLEQIGSLVLSGGGEMLMFAQLQASRETRQAAIDHVVLAKEVSEKTETQLALSEELLREAQEQTGTLKRFDTDLAVALVDALTTVFTPQMETMTNKLTDAINRLSEKVSTMNQDALDKMAEKFKKMLDEMTESEMKQLRETLMRLAENLEKAGTNFGDGAGKAAEKLGEAGGKLEEGAIRAAENLDKAGTDLLDRVEQISASLANGATNLQGATQGVKEAMNDLDVSIQEAADLGRQGSVFVRGALENADQVFGRLHSATEEINTAGNAFERISGRLTEALDSIEELTHEQRSVVTAVKETTPSAMSSIHQVLDVLRQTVQTTEAAMQQTRASMSDTSRTLGTTVSEITVGISEYSKMVADLHRQMDEQLAKAVGSLDKGTVSLEEAIEELGEVISDRFPKE